MPKLTHRVYLCLDGTSAVRDIIERVTSPSPNFADKGIGYQNAILILARAHNEDIAHTHGALSSLRIRVDVSTREVALVCDCVDRLRMQVEFGVMELSTRTVTVTKTVNKTSHYTTEMRDYGVVTDGLDCHGDPVPDDVLRLLGLYTDVETIAQSASDSLADTREYFAADTTRAWESKLDPAEVVAIVRSAVSNMGILVNAHDLRSLRAAMQSDDLETDIKKYVIESLLGTPAWSLKYTLRLKTEEEYVPSKDRLLLRLADCGVAASSLEDFSLGGLNLSWQDVKRRSDKAEPIHASSPNSSIIGHNLMHAMASGVSSIAGSTWRLRCGLKRSSASDKHNMRKSLYYFFACVAAEWMGRYTIVASLTSGTAAGGELISSPDLLETLLGGGIRMAGAKELFDVAASNILDRDLRDSYKIISGYMNRKYFSTYFGKDRRNLTEDLQHVRKYADNPPSYTKADATYYEPFYTDLLLRMALEVLSLDTLVCLPGGQAKFAHNAMLSMRISEAK